MKVLDPGHQYELEMLDVPTIVEKGTYVAIPTLQFVKREGPGYPGNKGHYHGTNIQEVLRVLIDRIQYLQGQKECPENRMILRHLRHCIMLLEQRAARRHGDMMRMSEVPLEGIESMTTCKTCGHIRCNVHAS